ncbi:carboxypeptidase-like regulatory domain-containing protein [Mucilaginibacter sp. RB4R14]|uniref:carboxypeptidase-like regulatory domain-containing protein n=1 Tax=Mucilaginibacter aurantiaciroseus TaxID=2949308 RepID=UPI0020909A10|nr:carboxypeptidase-like regulatory domain-containing protein [Mucilaginibacter aurantiaciroseus]MCO5937088.1 carboxypeptidase-like regulatory domain-containing protein [Mucilaginibacter aurantiaciroseus]
MKNLLLAFLLLPVTCIAQISITGKLTNNADKSPVADASVFLSNATVGNRSANDGAFILRGVKPGQYELVVTVIGYETYRQIVLAAGDNITLPDIKLTAKTTILNEVSIRPDPNWARNYDIFKREFLGSSDMAANCKILNPGEVSLQYDKASRKLTGSSYDFLEIENKALGYRVKYLLGRFLKDTKINLVYFEGSALYEEMKGSAKDRKRWLKNRRLAYEGSSMQFLRGLVGNDLDGNGFKVLRLIRKPNPDFNGLNDKYFQTLVNVPLDIADFTALTDQKGVYALKYTDCLYVMYIKKRDDDKDSKIFRSLTMPNYLTTIVSFDAPYALFDSNGIVINPSAINFEGNWAKSRVAEMLPVDYTPEGK